MDLSDTPEDQVPLREYLGILRHRKWSIIVATAVVVAGALFLSLRQTPIYASTSKVLVKAIDFNNPLALLTNLISMDTEREVAQSASVAELAADDLGGNETAPALLGHLTVSPTGAAQVLEFRYSDPSPLRAQEGANAFADAYIVYKTRQAQDAVDSLREPLLAELADALRERRDLEARIGSGPATPADAARRDELSSRIAQLEAQLFPLNAIVPDPGDVLQPAILPSSPASPNHVSNAILGLMAGLTLGGVVAFVRERMDDRLRGRTDLEAQAGATVLAVIPKVAGWKKRDQARLVTATEPRSAASEAYRSLRTSMLFAAAQRDVRTILLASPAAGEGKTTTTANLAVVLANAEKRVIVLSADLRKPRIHRFFKVDNKVGLVNVLAGEAELFEAVVDPGIDNLRVLPSGRIPSNPAELLGSEAMGELVAELRGVADFILIDTAPLLVVSDALALAPLTDGVLLVADAGRTTRGAVAHTREQLGQVGAAVIGSVLNAFDPSMSRAYPYYYRYYYRYRYGGQYAPHAQPEGPAPAVDEPRRRSMWAT